MRFNSIRARITAITTAAVLTTVLAVVVAAALTVQRENDRRSVEMMNLIADDTGKSVERYLDSIEQSLDTAANLANDSIDSMLLIDCGAAGTHHVPPSKRTDEQNQRLDEYLAAYCAELQPVVQSISDRSYGVTSYYYCIDPGVSVNEHGFFRSKMGKTGFAEREAIDAGSLDPDDSGQTAWYYNTIKSGRPIWTGPYKSDLLDDMWICSYTIPVYDSGTLIGVIGLDISVDTFASQLSDVKVYKTGFACLFNDEDRVIYHPDYETGEKPDNYGKAFSEQQLRQRSNGNELVRYTAGGKRRQMSYTTLASGMVLAITAPTKEINASWRHMLMILLITMAAILVFFIGLGLYAVRRITQPISDLTTASQRLAAGDYDVALDYDRDDEIGVLNGAFIQMRDRISQYIEDLNHRINTDSLTDLPKMRYFFELAEAEKKRLSEDGKDSVMVYFNLIGISHFNRQYGFEEGDRLLIEFAGIISKQFGDRCVCRMGDDHFAAIAAEGGIEEKAEAVIREAGEMNGGKSVPVCMGVYPYRLGDTDVSEACDRAKYICDLHRGEYESSWHVFESSMTGEIERARHIVSNLDTAIKEQWIKVYYQPIVGAKSRKVCDVEALSRWDDPEFGFLSPGEFIPVLEKTRLIYKVDLYVLDRIIEKMKRQAADGLPVVPHSLNLSRSDFESCDIVAEICRRMDDAGIARDRLTIEITESMLGSDFEFMKEQVLRFRKEGFNVWMDDFGSGYSSLVMLQDIHFDLLKFDMLFLHRLDEGEESRIILREMSQMAIELGTETICEGVETKEQADFLMEIGVTKLQGYYFSKPVPYEEVLERYRNGTHPGYEEV